MVAHHFSPKLIMINAAHWRHGAPLWCIVHFFIDTGKVNGPSKNCNSHQGPFTAMMLTFQFTPTTPVPCFPTAPIMPATWVP